MFPGSGQRWVGRTALVTGGSSGIGRHLVESLVGLGVSTFFCSNNLAEGRSVTKELGSAARFIPCELSEPPQVQAFVQEVADQAKQIDYLVNNAAIDPRIDFAETTVEQFDQIVAINLRAYFLVIRAALPWLSSGSSVVNLCTTNYLLGLTPFTVYNAAKSGIIGLSRSLARELGPRGIRVNTVSPGWIMTRKQLRDRVSEMDKADLLEAQSLKFLLDESHVTPAILFLLSEGASGITGQNLIVDAGKFMQ
jgi:NAD(P)-dependent dehydrogenase (short-subunit alcohol dehydrogenase family)